jgi:hypothetical protein
VVTVTPLVVVIAPLARDREAEAVVVALQLQPDQVQVVELSEDEVGAKAMKKVRDRAA